MVNITNGSSYLTVTKGAFESIYKPIGFHISSGIQVDVPDNASKHEEIEPEEEVEAVEPYVDIDGTEEVDENTAFLAEIVEKPVSQWSKADVKKYTELNGIDTKGAKSVSDVKEIIKKHMEEQQRAGV